MSFSRRIWSLGASLGLLVSCGGEDFVGRNDYHYYGQDDFSGGIDLRAEKARPNQVLDARNVWAPDGALVQRPGYLGVPTNPTYASVNLVAENYQFLAEGALGFEASVAGAGLPYTLTQLLSGGGTSIQSVGDRWYVGLATAPFTLSGFQGLGLQFDDGGLYPSGQTADVYAGLEYWNGTAWVGLALLEQESNSQYTAGRHFNHQVGNANPNLFAFVPPRDWAPTTSASITGGAVNSDTVPRYWVRFEIKERCDAVASALSFKNDIVYYLRNNYSTSGVSAEFIVSQFGRERLYSFITAGTAGVGFRTSDSLAFVAARTALGGETFSRDISIDEPACVVSIPERAEFFVSKGAAIFRGRREYYNSLNLAARVTFAEVEISDSLVGEVDGVKAPYNPSYVSQLGEFPRAKYITYFGNRLWVAGITGAPFQVRWSAASPAHKVWPEEAFEELSEDDNSPITALAATDEHLMVFKRDSVWKAVLSKIDDIGIADYDFVKIKSGVGCVSQASIANTPAGLLFLAEDGIYLTDGSRVEKVSQGIQSVVNSLTQAKFKAAAGVHWKKYHAYLLSVSTGGSPTNNLVLVFDYQNGAWWIWDNFEASFWMKEEDSADNERVYFGDADGYIYELGAANHDHYEQINWWVKPHRFGYKDRPSKTFRNLQVGATSDTKNISWELSYNDDERDQNAGTLDFANDVLDSISDGLTGSDELDRELRKGERASLRKTAGWGTLKLESNENTEKAEIHSIELGVVPKGTR